ncbi:RNA polymerase sigma-70 factor [Marinilabiliaceae bacterium JC017]|nr:RNA polymerase sigma-70 factor [Marinilabiliaceae bacterium JC017]
MNTTSTQFIDLLKHGNEIAFSELYTLYFTRLHFFANQFIDDHYDAENLVQDTFFAFWSNKESILASSINGIQAWLYNTLKRKCINHLDHLKIEKKHQDALLMTKRELDLEALSEMDFSECTFNELEKKIKEAINELTPQCKKVFELNRFEGLKNKEIAQHLNISLKAVESNMTRALKSLRIKLCEYLPLCLWLLKF